MRERWFRAPGRVNLIGDHADYNDGFVLPMAIDRDCVTIRREAPTPSVVSLDGDPGHQEALERFLAAALRTLEHHSAAVDAARLEVRSEVPLGAGLSSSAALGVCLVRALTADLELDPVTLARWARDAEELATGVACGLMDQMASACGIAGHALLVDCADVTVSPVPLPDEIGIVVVHSGVARTVASTAYLERRRACEEIARRLGVPSLREATSEQVVGEPLARHVVTENRRVLHAADALRAGDLEALGALVLASHVSLRDDYAVSTPELDALVDLLVAEGAAGARLSGAGFGGCVVGVGPASEITAIGERAAARYEADTGLGTFFLVPRAVDGASEIANR